MLFLAMGSETYSEDFVGREEAAKILKVNVRTIARLAKNGVLRPSADGKYSMADLSAAGEIMLDEGQMTLATAVNASLRALVAAKRAERGVDQLSALLGVDIPRLATNEEGVLALYEQVKDAEKLGVSDISAPVLLIWARTFLGASEEYFELVEKHTGNEEPWLLFLSLAEHLTDSVSGEMAARHKDIATALGCLDMARRHLRHVAYFCARKKHGPRTAQKMFPAAELDPHERIIQLMFPG